jgi:hypothetical protein
MAPRNSRVTVHELWVSYFFQEDAGGGGVQMGEGGVDQRSGLRVEEEVLQGDSYRGSLDFAVVQADEHLLLEGGVPHQSFKEEAAFRTAA